MLRNHLYYHLKPLFSRRIRVAVRRWFALRKLGRVRDRWPILPGSERPPAGWSGWPDRKQFALVLTHDVEGQAGLDKCSKLMAIEKHLGFRSSFTLIPKGEYEVTREIREGITREGFELAVHDYFHDGKLFLMQKEFKRNAPEINRHLKEWNAVGFRAGFMLRKLEWLHELDIKYDMSTFDTDPFEPQPQGQGTIFPFWVPRPGGRDQGTGIRGQVSETSAFSVQHSALPSDPQVSDPSAFSVQPSALPGSPSALASGSSPGYIELPYTLPQDSTLFLLLQERHPDIWFQKLDWIAQHGGMALINVHPDYMRFEGESASSSTYPVEMYTRFLEYARHRYGDSFWQPLPHQVASHALQWRRSLSPVR